MVHMFKLNSRTIAFLAIISIIIVVLAFVIFTHAGSQANLLAVPGVHKGDYVIYDIKGFSDSTDPAIVSESFYQYNMTESYKITVTDVTNASISLSTTWRFTNGTEFQGSSTVDVESGMVFPSGGFWAIYAGNLDAGDPVRPTGPDRSTVNQTSTRQYASGSRDTNRISMDIEYYDSNDPTGSTTWTEYMNIHFDRATGFLVEFRDTNVFSNPQITLTTLWTIRETNVWTV